MTDPDIPDAAKPADPDYRAKADLLAQTLRTAFPALWALIVAWLVQQVPALHGWIDGTVGNVAAGVVLVVLVAALYRLFRLLEKQTWVPKWLVLLLLGSAKQPLSVARPVANAVRGGATVQLTATPTGTRVGVKES